jgi:cathepsin L
MVAALPCRKYDHGCEGGGWLNAIQYTIKNRGLATEEEYPYIAKDGKCNKKLEHEK